VKIAYMRWAAAYEVLNDPQKKRAYESFEQQQHWHHQQHPGQQQQQQQQRQRQWERPETEDIPEELREFFEAFMRAHDRQKRAGTAFDWDGTFFEWDGGKVWALARLGARRLFLGS
jgi:DnaJ-class molecular chaperone